MHELWPVMMLAELPPLLRVSWDRVELVLLISSPLVVAALWWRDVIRPGSLEGGKTRDVSQHSAGAWFAAAGAFFCACVMVAGAMGSLPESVTGPSDGLKAHAMSLMGTYAVLGCLGVCMLRLVQPAEGSDSGLRFRAADGAAGLWSFVVSLPILIAAAFLSVQAARLVTGSTPDPVAHSELRRIVESLSDPWSWGVIVAVTLASPLVEEVLYRGLLQSAILRATQSAWAAVLVSSAVFTVVHWSLVQWHAMPVLFVLSVAMGIAFERTRGLAAPIVMHVCFNAANILVATGGG